MTQRIIAYWHQGIGQRRGDLEDGAMPVLHQCRALLIARGLQKLLLDDCVFAEPTTVEILRTAALAESATRLRTPLADGEAHRRAVAEALAVTVDDLAERLYGDLPDMAVLESVPTINADTLIACYNMALCQGLLIHARQLHVTLFDADTGLRRKLLKALRFRRLLAEVTQDGQDALQMTISGPASVLDQGSRYGLQLALFLPALACAKNWRATATIQVPRADSARSTANLVLGHDTDLIGDSAFLGYIPDELRTLNTALSKQCPEWTFADAQLIPLANGELVVPDVQFSSGGHTYAVELFHRWHGHALKRRLDHIATGALPRLIIGIDRALAKTTDVAPLLETSTFKRHGFLFSDIPVPRALRDAFARMSATV